MSQADVIAINELTSELRGFREDLSVFRTQLFGQVEGENPQGRLPRIEAKRENHERRIVRIERFTWIGAGVVLMLAFADKATDFVYHILSIVRH